jgi:hypothetical protein
VIDRGARRRLEERRAIETALQDGLHSLETRAADRDGACARGIDTLAAVAIGETDDAEARAVAGLGVRAAAHDRTGELADVATDALGPRDDAFGRPLAILAVKA